MGKSSRTSNRWSWSHFWLFVRRLIKSIRNGMIKGLDNDLYVCFLLDKILFRKSCQLYLNLKQRLLNIFYRVEISVAMRVTLAAERID